MSCLALLPLDIIRRISLQCSYEESVVIFELGGHHAMSDTKFWFEHIRFHHPKKHLQILFQDAITYHQLYYVLTLIMHYTSNLRFIPDNIYQWFITEGDMALIYFIVDNYSHLMRVSEGCVLNRLIPYMFNKYVDSQRSNNNMWNALLYIFKHLKHLQILPLLMTTLTVENYDLVYMLIHEQSEKCPLNKFCPTCREYINL